MGDEVKLPPGVEPEGDGTMLKITNAAAFIEAVAPTINAQLDTISDAPGDGAGEGWSGTMTCIACPVQIEGTVDGMHFYFRARWGSWAFSVAETKREAVDVAMGFSLNGWSTEGQCDEELGGSWMKHSEAWALVRSGIEAWRAQKGGA